MRDGRYHFSGNSRIFDHEIELDGSFAPEGSEVGTFLATIKGESFGEQLITFFSELQTETTSGNFQRDRLDYFLANTFLEVSGHLGSDSFNWKILYNHGDETVVIENLVPNLTSFVDLLNFVKLSLKDPFLVFCNKKRSLNEENDKPQKKSRL